MAKIFTERSGVLWWTKKRNHWQSVWFDSKKAFLFGRNLADQNLFDVLAEGNKCLEAISELSAALNKTVTLKLFVHKVIQLLYSVH